MTISFPDQNDCIEIINPPKPIIKDQFVLQDKESTILDHLGLLDKEFLSVYQPVVNFFSKKPKSQKLLT